MKLAYANGNAQGSASAARASAVDDAQLIARVITGESLAIASLEEHLAPMLRTRARAFLARQGGHSVAVEQVDDLCQQVWLSLMRDNWAPLRAFDPARGVRLSTYVAKIAATEWLRRRRELSAQKRAGGQRCVPLDDTQHSDSRPDSNPETHVEKQQLLHGLLAHLHTNLPARGQLVLQLLYHDGLPVQDAANFLGASPQVIYNWQHRIRRMSRAYLDDHGGPPL